MVGRIFSTLITAAVAGAIGYGTGVYLTPPDKADEFRALVNGKLDAITNAIPRKRAAIEPTTTVPIAPEITAAQPEAAPTQIQSEAPALPRSDAPAGDASIQKDMPENNPIAPIAPQAESNNSQLAPPASAESVASVPTTAPADNNSGQLAPVVTAESAAPIQTASPLSAESAEKAPVAKPRPKSHAKKAKPKKKAARQHPKAEPDAQPPAEEPAQ
jgi:hypothetical protein